MKRPLLLTLGLMGLSGLNAQAADYNAFVAIGGMKTTAGNFPVICSTESCFDSFFAATPGEVAATSGGMDDGVVAFDGWAEGWHSSLLTLHAGAGLAVTASEGIEGHRWFANSQVAVNTTLVSYWSDPDDAEVRLFYRFDGSATAASTGAAEAQSYGRVFGSTLGQQAMDCLPVDGVPGQCMIVIPGRASGEVFDYSVMLQAITEVAVTPAGGAYAGTVEADYRHTLSWTGVELVSEKTGAPLTGWTLATADDGVVLFSSPVPEPPAALLAALGLAALAWRRYST